MNIGEVEKNIEVARELGYRPVVVACIVHRGKILFLFQRKFQLWQLPQGGIEPKENIYTALFREVNEELGEFSKYLQEKSLKFLGEDLVEFPKDKQGKRKLIDANGFKHFMLGKKYFFVLVESKKKMLDISRTEFEKYRWVDLVYSRNLTTQIYQKGKRRITERAIELIGEAATVTKESR